MGPIPFSFNIRACASIAQTRGGCGFPQEYSHKEADRRAMLRSWHCPGRYQYRISYGRLGVVGKSRGAFPLNENPQNADTVFDSAVSSFISCRPRMSPSWVCHFLGECRRTPLRAKKPYLPRNLSEFFTAFTFQVCSFNPLNRRQHVLRHSCP